MSNAVGSVLGLAVGVALSPVPFVASTVVLSAPRGGRNGGWFAIGWAAGLMVLGVLAVLLAQSLDTNSATTQVWRGWSEVVVGAAALVVGLRVWQTRVNRDASDALPGWLSAVDRLGPARVLGLGSTLAVLNPKNAPLTVAAGLSIGDAGGSAGTRALHLAAFVGIASLCVLIPLGLYYAFGANSVSVLDALRAAFLRRRAAIMAATLGILGLIFIADGVGHL